MSPQTRLLGGQAQAWITVPRAFLALPLAVHACAAVKGAPAQPAFRPRWGGDFVGSLKSVLVAYLCEGTPSIDLAAELSGTSLRTFQRRLGAANTTYSELLQQTRFELARALLADPDRKVIDIAFEVGYEDPAHFTRAFRRMAGYAPQTYRRELLDRAGAPLNS